MSKKIHKTSVRVDDDEKVLERVTQDIIEAALHKRPNHSELAHALYSFSINDKKFCRLLRRKLIEYFKKEWKNKA